jgi:hypothetical protein
MKTLTDILMVVLLIAGICIYSAKMDADTTELAAIKHGFTMIGLVIMLVTGLGTLNNRKE